MIIEIEKELKEREITRLCHYVHTNKLLHILNSEEGIAAVDFIDKDVLLQNDSRRLDGKTNFVNCSIQYPNFWYYNKVKNNNSVFPDWALIFIDPIISADETTEFCPVNAAKRFGAYVRKGYPAFKSMFDRQVEGYHRTPQMLKNAPTDDQAEVLIYRNVPRKYITGIAFKEAETAKQKIGGWEILGVPKIDIYIAPELFERTASDKIRKGIKPEEYLYMG